MNCPRALAALLIIIPFSWSASAFTVSGGPAAYGAVFGRFVGFELGWVYYVARCAAFAANANVLTDYVARWVAGADQGLARAAILITVTGLFAAAVKDRFDPHGLLAPGRFLGGPA